MGETASKMGVRRQFTFAILGVVLGIAVAVVFVGGWEGLTAALERVAPGWVQQVVERTVLVVAGLVGCLVALLFVVLPVVDATADGISRLREIGVRTAVSKYWDRGLVLLAGVGIVSFQVYVSAGEGLGVVGLPALLLLLGFCLHYGIAGRAWLEATQRSVIEAVSAGLCLVVVTQIF